MKGLNVIAVLLSSLSLANAWGVVGHEAVATIAQIYMYPSAIEKLKEILPVWTKGRLSPVAAWPDRIRYQMPWSGQLHYVSPENDHPPNACSFGDFKNDRNVLTAIANYTMRFQETYDDIDLRFLTHFVGDVHQPLHLMERERGGNGDPVTFDHRHFSLHGVWDTQIIARSVRELHNYTSPLPSHKIEDALRGSIYDSYVRWIVVEGIERWWREDVPNWLTCSAHAQSSNGQQVFSSSPSTTLATCFEEWAKPIHDLTCQYVFPENYDPHETPLREIGGPDYYGKIRKDKLIEGLLAQAGLRLAALLNSILADEEELAMGALFDWKPESRAIEQTWQWKMFGSKGLLFL